MNWTSRTGRRWELLPAEETATEAIRRAVDVHPVVARILAARGFAPSSAAPFLAAEDGPFHDPGLLLGLPAAVARIEQAIRAGEHIRLVTDYDVDGTTSCLILHAALDRRIQAQNSAAIVSYHVPDRFKEGYGLSALAVETAAADGVRLLVTADIGVRDHVTVGLAQQRGIEIGRAHV